MNVFFKDFSYCSDRINNITAGAIFDFDSKTTFNYKAKRRNIFINYRLDDLKHFTE